MPGGDQVASAHPLHSTSFAEVVRAAHPLEEPAFRDFVSGLAGFSQFIKMLSD